MVPDGFRAITSDELELGAELNLQRYRNDISPFSEVENARGEGAGLFVDTHYGLTYDEPFLGVRALYGATEALPAYGVDRLATMGFLRVPFRRIPRIRIRNQNELDAFIGGMESKDKNLRILYRGQSREYFTGRSPESRERLFGDAEALEPSMPSSAVRAGMQLEQILPEWCWILRLFIAEQLSEAGRWASPQTMESLQSGYDRLIGDFGLHLFALALAQHYGLPSAGVDVTPDPRIAVFFAMHSFTRPTEGSRMLTAVPKKPGDEPGVLYVMGVGERFSLGYDSFRPRSFPVGRPDRQRAFFMHTGWGLSRNECARRIFAALYLDPAGRFTMPGVAELFPTAGEDRFARFLLDVAPSANPHLSDYLGRLYWVAV